MLTQDETKRMIALLDEISCAEAVSARDTLLEGDSPDKTVKLARIAVESASSRILKVLDESDDKPACQKGCSYCCHFMVEASAPEVLAIAQYIRQNFTQEEQEQLMRSIDENINATQGMTRKERFVFRAPCALLKNGACSVYDIRPVMCRAWHSMDVESCKNDFEHPSFQDTVQVNRMAVQAGVGVEAGLAVALTHQRLDSRCIELIRGLKIAMTDASLLSNWRSNPKAFDAAARNDVHPDPENDRNLAWGLNKIYVHVVNSPEWRSS
jgi:Fe-S-cluster containining protein